MKNCPYCGYSNYDTASVCRKCDASFVAQRGQVYDGKGYWIGPEKAKHMRSRGLSLVVLGLLVKVYWGGYGPWSPIDFPVLVTLRTYLEPILLYGGVALYVFGWIANFV